MDMTYIPIVTLIVSVGGPIIGNYASQKFFQRDLSKLEIAVEKGFNKIDQFQNVCATKRQAVEQNLSERIVRLETIQEND